MAQYFSTEYKRGAGGIQIRRYFSISESAKIAYVEFRTPVKWPGKKMARIGSLSILNVTERGLTVIPKAEFTRVLEEALTLIFEGICHV